MRVVPLPRRLWAAVLIALLLAACSAATPTPPRLLRVATDAASPPFSFEQNGEAVGFDIDLMRAVAQEMGMQTEFSVVTFDVLLEGIARGDYDAAISAITITEARKDTMLFSIPYFNAGQLVVVARDDADITTPDDLSGRRVGAMVATTGADKARSLGADVTEYLTLAEAYAALAAGDQDAVLADNPLALIFIDRYGGRLRAVGAPITYEQYGIAVRRNAPVLLEDINRALAAVMERGLLRELQQKWMQWDAPR